MHQFERGFKSWAERTSLSVRREIGLSAEDPLELVRLANCLDVRLATPKDIPGLPADVLDQLLLFDPWGWSAVSACEGDVTVVIYNPRHSKARQSSDITHELAHIILGHQPATIIMSHDGSMVMRSFNERQEHEANWLAASLLLPRDALISCKQHELTIGDAAHKYGVSEKLVVFRMRITGVDRQWQAATRRR